MYGLLSIMLALPCAAPAGVPLVTVPPVTGGLQIDGQLSEKAWARAQQIALMNSLSGRGKSTCATVFLLRDGHNLYVGARFPKPRGRLPKAQARQRDGQLWQDDALEVFLDPGATGSRYYQFIANVAGVRWDSYGKDGSWDARWQAAGHARAADASWTLEMAIPFAAVGSMPRDADRWGFNVAWDCQTPTAQVLSWAPLKSSLHQPKRFGLLSFATEPPLVKVVAAAISPVSGKVTFSPRVSASALPATVEHWFGRQGQLQPRNKVAIPAQKSQQLDLSAQVPLSKGLPAETGDFASVVQISAGGRAVYRAVFSLSVPPRLNITTRKYLLRTKRIDMEITGGLLSGKYRLQRAEAALVGADGRPLATAKGSFDQQGRAALSLDVKKVAPGDYDLRLRVFTPDKQPIYDQVVEEVILPPTPKWLGNREGITDKVLPPWTPIKVRGSSVRPWGRDYRWGALPFPTSVVTRGAEMLAGPIRLIAVVDGKQQAWMGGKPVFTRKTPARVEFTTRAEGQSASLRGSLWCEYDGCVRCDWELVPKKRGARLEKLVFEIPYKAEHARYIYHFPGRWRSAYNAGAVPPEGLTMAFRPFVWLGDEWRGLAWFCPSDEVFRPADPARVTQVTRQGDVVLLQVNMVEKPIILNNPLRTTFGFEATPVRHNDQDVWDYRIIHTGAYGLEERPWSPPMEVTWPAEGNFNVREGTLEAWVRPHFDPQVPVKPGDPGRGRYNRNFFIFKFGGYTVGYYWNIDDRGMRLYVQAPNGRYPVILGANNGWKKGEWHHIAVSWGKEIRLYDNGKLLAKRPYEGLLLTTPENLLGGTLTLGPGRCDMDVDDFCISDVQRAPRGQAGPLQPDAHTLLLEDFSKLSRSPAGVQTVPLKAGGGPGDVQGPAKLLPGKFGIGLALAYLGPKTTALDRYEQLGVKTICFHEHWSRIQNYFAPADPEGLHKLVKACHQHGIRLLVYYGYELSDLAPEWKTYRDEVLVYPRGGGYHRQPEQHCYICCYHSAWQDYLAWAIARTMDEYDMDGVYLDGTANPFGCANLGHGCGYIGEDGKLHRTYPFFTTREMMKRIYAIVKTRKPNGLVNVHQSTCMTIPSVGWATSYWDGEQFGSIPRSPENWPLKILPLDAFRTEFMGHNWGVPAELLCYRRPYTYAEALAIALPHDVLVRPNDVELASKIWQAAADFGRKEARWLPYWENRQWVKVNDDDVKCSLYTRGRRGVLVVVSNLGKEPLEARLWLNWRRLDLPRDLRGRDALTGEPVECEAGRVRLQMQPLEFRILRLEPAQKRE